MSRAGARVLAELIFLIHTALVLILVLGWLLSPPYYYVYLAVLFVTFVTQLIWRYCLLTTWEFYFRRLYDPSIGPTPYYLTYYSHKMFPGLVSETLVDRLSLVFLSASLVLAGLHVSGNL